jgi:hypothetical protein
MQPEAADGRPRYPEFLARLQSIAAERLRQNERILAEEALEVCRRRRRRRHARERSVIVRRAVSLGCGAGLAGVTMEVGAFCGP